MINTRPRLSRTSANRLFNTLQATESIDDEKHGLDHVLDKNRPDKDDEKCLASSHALSPVAIAHHQSPNCTPTNFFPELQDR